MHKWVVAIALILLASACSSRIDEAKAALATHLGEKVYLEFTNVEEFSGGAVCGEYRSNDPVRGSSRYRQFLAWGDSAIARPSKADWAFFCTEDSAAVLLAHFGIGPVEQEAKQLQQIREDLHRLQTALEAYRTDNGALPTPEQGLTALVSKPASGPPAIQYREGGYLDTLPVDPWGRPYVYTAVGLGGGVAQQFTLYTLGADGRSGGEGPNADVKLSHLNYLDYLLAD